MVSTNTAIEEFSDTIRRYSTEVEENKLESIAKGIWRLRTQNPNAYDEKAVARYLKDRAVALRDLVEEYFTTSIARKFPLISSELFDLKRYLTLVREGNNLRVISDDTEMTKRKENKTQDIEKKTIVAPLFAYTPLFDGKHTAEIASFSKQKNYRKKTWTFEAKLPGNVGPNLKNAYREALSHYFEVLSEMFMDPVAGDIMYAESNLGYNKKRIDEFIRPEIGAIWIPTPESLNVKVKEELIKPRKNLDPAMILKVRRNSYLVKTWNVDDEEPFENYLREWSTGDLKGKLD